MTLFRLPPEDLVAYNNQMRELEADKALAVKNGDTNRIHWFNHRIKQVNQNYMPRMQPVQEHDQNDSLCKSYNDQVGPTDNTTKKFIEWLIDNFEVKQKG